MALGLVNQDDTLLLRCQDEIFVKGRQRKAFSLCQLQIRRGNTDRGIGEVPAAFFRESRIRGSR